MTFSLTSVILMPEKGLMQQLFPAMDEALE
jgi:hypothetical protein